jgi:AraC-like DNA-binding protein
MRTDIHIGILDIFIFLGVFQGFFLSWFFIIKCQNDKRANLYQGLVLFFLSLSIFEGWLNNTGYIVKVLAITNFSEPLNFTFAPLIYLYVVNSLNPQGKRKEWAHFIPAIFWLIYMVFQFIQPDELKYNSYIRTNHPDWDYLEAVTKISDDPLGVGQYINQMTAIQLFIYISAIIVILIKKFRSVGHPLFSTDNELLIILRNTVIHFILLIAIFLATKIYFGMDSDVGDYLIATYVSFMIYSTSYRVLKSSDYFDKPGSFFAFPMMKYEKSSLSDESKEMILAKIRREMEDNSYFKNRLASLPGLAKQINETSHHVSQVINEKLNKNFFELLASYRVEHAKKLIHKDKNSKLTVEELADIVGYNSKSSFNIAFKKYTLKTPSEYRKSLTNL